MQTNVPSVDFDELMEKIREEVRQRQMAETETAQCGNDTQGRLQHQKPSGVRVHDSSSDDDRHWLPMDQGSYCLGDFLNFHDHDFICNAYRGILKRNPDSSGYKIYKEKLRNGELTKEEIIGRLRYSPEGRANRVRIRGAFLPLIVQSSFRIPVLGYLFRLLVGIVRLPIFITNFRRLDADLHAHLEELRQSCSEACKSVEEQMDRLQSVQDRVSKVLDFNASLEANVLSVNEMVSKGIQPKIESLEQQVQSVRDELNEKASLSAIEQLQRHKADREELDGMPKRSDLEQVIAQQIDPLRSEMVEQVSSIHSDHEQITADARNLSARVEKQVESVLTLRRGLVEQERRLKILLEEIRSRVPEPIGIEEMEAISKETDHFLEALYVSFEDDFRGLREDIKDRAKAYLPLFETDPIGSKEFPILDIGCGRGELLELLQEEGIASRGVDINRVMVKECNDRGLAVVEQDVVAHLRSLPDSSIGAVVGLHIIEHLGFDTLIDLLDESLRVLKKGGLLILETPNPKNLFVGSADFYMDPTHRNPIHPDAIRYLLEARGFGSVVSYFFQEIHGQRRLLDSRQVRLQTVEDHAGVSRDYAVVGRRS